MFKQAPLRFQKRLEARVLAAAKPHQSVVPGLRNPAAPPFGRFPCSHAHFGAVGPVFSLRFPNFRPLRPLLRQERFGGGRSLCRLLACMRITAVCFIHDFHAFPDLSPCGYWIACTNAAWPDTQKSTQTENEFSACVLRRHGTYGRGGRLRSRCRPAGAVPH